MKTCRHPRPLAALALAALAALAAQPASAQNMKPGLWEASDKIAGNGTSPILEMQLRQIARMKPSQRKQMEALLASQGLTVRKDGVIQKVCVTPEMAAETALPIQQQGGCDYKLSPKVGGTVKYSFTCANPPAKGDGSITFAGTTAYRGSMQGTSSITGRARRRAHRVDRPLAGRQLRPPDAEQHLLAGGRHRQRTAFRAGFGLCWASSTSDTGATMKIGRIAFSLPALALAALAAQPALAQNIKPGLWETNNKMGAGSGKLQGVLAMAQQQIAGMAPDQRKQVEGMMARQGVVISNDGVVAKMCITPDMAARQQLPIQQHGNCSYQHAPVVGNGMKFSFSCTNPQASGEGSATFVSPTAYTASMRVTTNATGASETMNIESSAQWLGADCGAVKPVTLPAAP